MVDAPPAPRDAPAVRRLGRYELITPLAKGGMGEVHLARTRGVGGFERLVVVKCALPWLAERSQQMLLAEARLAATLQHTNIVQVQDVGTEGATVFIAMEFLHGQDLRAVMRRSWGTGRALPIDQAIAIALSVCAGLHYAHDKHDTDGQPLEIVHRDVSPSNVFVTYDGNVKLIDFGIAKATALPSETQLGTVKGKPGHMSPEQCRCEPLDRRSDVFSVGILLFELTAGTRCFGGDNEYQFAKQIMEGEPAWPNDYPPALHAIVARALAKDRRDRYATAIALQEALAAFASGLRLDVSQFALGRTMASLFADELAAWRAAQRSGQSLVEHVIKRTTTNVAIVDAPSVGTADVTTPDKGLATQASPVGKAPRRRRLFVVLAALAGGAIAIAIAIVVAASSGASQPASQTTSSTSQTSQPQTSTSTPTPPPPPPTASSGSQTTPAAQPQPAAAADAGARARPARDATPSKIRTPRAKPPKPPGDSDPDALIQ